MRPLSKKRVASLHGIADRIFMDRMNYLGRLKAFYRRHKLDWATKDAFSQEYKTQRISELRKRKMNFQTAF